jgi:hypothetical protein
MSATFSTQKPRGKLFVKGMKKLGGRPKGSANVQTKAIKTMIEAAAHGLGGVARLIEWAKETPQNEYAFWIYLWPRLLPLQIAGSGERGEIEMNIKLTAEELTKQLADRGLPTMIFGIDKPVLELPSARIEGEGTSGDERSCLPAAERGVDPRPARDALAGDPVPLLEAMEEQIRAPDSASDASRRAFLEARMARHVGRYGGST